MARKKVLRKDKKCYLDFVWLSDAEYEHLCVLLGKEKTNKYIDELNLYIGSKGDPYESHYYTIQVWERRAKSGAIQNSKLNIESSILNATRSAARVIEAIKDAGNKTMPSFDKTTFAALYAVLRKRMMRWPELRELRHDMIFLEEIRTDLEKELSLAEAQSTQRKD